MKRSSSAAAESGWLRSAYDWVDERLDLSELIEHAEKKQVPVHRHSFWYYWGGLSLFFFLIQCVTGVLLLIYYRPGPEAYQSVRYITYDVDFGWLVRSAHSWSANLMVFAVVVHMFSAFFMKAYRKPREFGWWTGLALLGLTFVFGFSGYLLPMDELAYFATKVGLEIPVSQPVIGPVLSNIIRGGPDVSEITIQRFFALHVVILPALFLPMLGAHLFLVQKHGNAVPPSEEKIPESKRRSIPFFPNFLAKDLAMWLLALNLLALMASLFPWDLGPQADPLAAAPEGIHPEWYFMWQFQILKVLGNWFPGITGEILGIGLFTVGGVLWGLIPLYDTRSAPQRRARQATWFGLLVLFGVLFFTIWGYLAL